MAAEKEQTARNEAKLDKGRKFYGANLGFIHYDGTESMLSGPAETGKTFSALHKLDRLARTTPNGQFVIIRKTRTSMDSTVLRTMKRIIADDVIVFGGEKPQWYDYPNGARIWIAGMDSSSKVLSGERDAIYVNQAEELTLADWETLTTRATGRGTATGKSQIFGDCNPAGSSHWIPARARENKLKLFESRHTDNPTLYWQTGARKGQLTVQGHKTMKALNALTGIRKARLKDGRWANAEGAIYEYDPLIHLIEPFEIPDEWERIIAIDFGYINPFVVLWLAIDGDGRLYLYRYIYQTHRIVSEHADEMKRIIAGMTQDEWAAVTDKTEAYANTREWKRTIGIVSDHDAEDRATLNKAGFKTIAADKRVKVGIETVQDRLKLQGDGKPRLFFMRGALVSVDETLVASQRAWTIEQELDGYVWLPAVEGRAAKEEPLKKDDHAMDALRYACMQVDRPRFNYGF